MGTHFSMSRRAKGKGGEIRLPPFDDHHFISLAALHTRLLKTGKADKLETTYIRDNCDNDLQEFLNEGLSAFKTSVQLVDFL